MTTTPTRQRRHEAGDLQGMVRRTLRALVRRAAEGDTWSLEVLTGLEAEVSEAVAAGLRRAHDEAGYSWAQLAAELGTTRQAAHLRATRGERRDYYMDARPCPHGRSRASRVQDPCPVGFTECEVSS